MPYQQQSQIKTNSSNKVALITGAAKRIGKQIAKDLHQRDINIVIHYRTSENEAKLFCDELNHNRDSSACTVQADLTSNDADEKLIQGVLKYFNRLDYLVNNASIFYPTPFMQDNEKVISSFLTVNSLFPTKLIKRASAELKKRRGAIVNIVDIYANSGLAEHTYYVASKSILLEQTKIFAASLAPEVRVNSVSPGAILWPELEANDVSLQAEIIKNSALKRLGSAKDISKTVCYLLLEASYSTGANIDVDGGRGLYI